MEFVRTPDARFGNLPGFPYEPHYIDNLADLGLRMAYVDEGAGDETFLCLHGEPTWSYLYRKMIPVFTAAGHRVVAPDFFGFGRSDKPVSDAVYTWDFHRKSLVAFIEKMDLRRVTLVVQDWGGLLGLTLPMDMPERIDRLLVMNTALAIGATPGPGFLAWKDYAAANPNFDPGALLKRAVPGLSDAERAAYAAPFPDARSKAGARRFPAIVPINKTMAGAEISLRAREYLKNEWSGESFMAIGVQDPVLGQDIMERLREWIRGCPPALVLPEAGHFVQEHGDIVARAALAAWS